MPLADGPTPAPDPHSWSTIDSASDPAEFVRFLDATRRENRQRVACAPALAFDFLDIHRRHVVLDCGCGTGEDARAMAVLTGSSGQVVGIDSSAVMVAESRRRSAGKSGPVRFEVADVAHLPFADESFDRIHATTLLQHVPDPGLALTEMARVLRPGGLMAVTEHDWESLILPSPNHRLSRLVTQAHSGSIAHGSIGRHLTHLMRRAGLEVTVQVMKGSLTGFDTVRPWLLDAPLQTLLDGGSINATEAAEWLAGMERRAGDGRFVAFITIFRAVGRKGEPSGERPATFVHT